MAVRLEHAAIDDGFVIYPNDPRQPLYLSEDELRDLVRQAAIMLTGREDAIEVAPNYFPEDDDPEDLWS